MSWCHYVFQWSHCFPGGFPSQMAINANSVSMFMMPLCTPMIPLFLVDSPHKGPAMWTVFPCWWYHYVLEWSHFPWWIPLTKGQQCEQCFHVYDAIMYSNDPTFPGGFPSQRASNVNSVSMSMMPLCTPMIPLSLVDSPHKGPAMWIVFPCLWCHYVLQWSHFLWWIPLTKGQQCEQCFHVYDAIMYSNDPTFPGGFPSQRASNVNSVSMSMMPLCTPMIPLFPAFKCQGMHISSRFTWSFDFCEASRLMKNKCVMRYNHVIRCNRCHT